MFEELESESENFSGNRLEQVLLMVDLGHLAWLLLTKIRSKDQSQFESSKDNLNCLKEIQAKRST